MLCLGVLFVRGLYFLSYQLHPLRGGADRWPRHPIVSELGSYCRHGPAPFFPSPNEVIFPTSSVNAESHGGPWTPIFPIFRVDAESHGGPWTPIFLIFRVDAESHGGPWTPIFPIFPSVNAESQGGPRAGLSAAEVYPPHVRRHLGLTSSSARQLEKQLVEAVLAENNRFASEGRRASEDINQKMEGVKRELASFNGAVGSVLGELLGFREDTLLQLHRPPPDVGNGWIGSWRMGRGPRETMDRELEASLKNDGSGAGGPDVGNLKNDGSGAGGESECEEDRMVVETPGGESEREEDCMVGRRRMAFAEDCMVVEREEDDPDAWAGDEEAAERRWSLFGRVGDVADSLSGVVEGLLAADERDQRAPQFADGFLPAPQFADGLPSSLGPGPTSPCGGRGGGDHAEEHASDHAEDAAVVMHAPDAERTLSLLSNFSEGRSLGGGDEEEYFARPPAAANASAAEAASETPEITAAESESFTRALSDTLGGVFGHVGKITGTVAWFAVFCCFSG